MRARTIVITAAAVIAAVASAAVVVTWPLAGMFVSVAMQSARPQSISWDGKTAWMKCAGAIAGQVSWPPLRAARCQAMSLCANESSLTPAQTARLAAANRAAGCEPF